MHYRRVPKIHYTFHIHLGVSSHALQPWVFVVKGPGKKVSMQKEMQKVPKRVSLPTIYYVP